jgi:MscS family membrane protein
MDLIAEWASTFSTYTGLEPWAFSVFLVVFAALLVDFVQRQLMKRMIRVVRETENAWDDALFDAMIRPLSFVIWLVGFTMAAEFLPLLSESDVLDSTLVVRIRQIGILFAFAWFLMSFIKDIEHNLAEQSLEGKRKADVTTIKALSRVLRITVVVTAMLVGLDTLGVNIAGLMAAGGIGGLAVGLAARDMIANFFGGLTVFIDRPFGVGDWILLKDQGIEGVVEEIGWRQTTIRKFDKRPVYVPNATFTTASVETPSRMTHRRIYETIGIRYDDVAVMQPITEEVRQMLLDHPDIDTSQTLMVNFDAFGPSSLDFFVYCMTRTVVWQEYHEVKQDVLLRISETIDRHGASIAFPTRTVHIQEGPPPEPEETDRMDRENSE